MNAGQAKRFRRHLHRYHVDFGTLNAAVVDDWTDLRQLDRLVEVFGTDYGVVIQRIVSAAVNPAFGRYGPRGANRVPRADNRRTDPGEPASPALDLDLGFLGCIGLLAAMIANGK